MLRTIILILLASSVIQIQGHLLNKNDYGDSLDVNSIKVKRQTQSSTDLDDDLPEEDTLNLCDNSTIDAIFVLRDDTVYIFRGSLVWKVVRDKIQDGSPAEISEIFPGLENDLDAAFAYSDDGVVFFKGSLCWKFNDRKMEKGYPEDIQTAFPGIPNNIQAATRMGSKGYIYFFKGDQYWRYEPNQKPPVRSAYPKLIGEVFQGIPDNLDEALLYTNGNTYFFKSMRYWRLDYETLSEYVERNYHVPYPRLIAPWWLSCRPEP